MTWETWILTRKRQSVRILLPRMSDTGFTVSGMIEPVSGYDVTVTVDRDGGYLPDPAEFAVAAGQAASIKNASVVSAHTAEQVISVVTVRAAVAVALAGYPKR